MIIKLFIVIITSLTREVELMNNTLTKNNENSSSISYLHHEIQQYNYQDCQDSTTDVVSLNIKGDIVLPVIFGIGITVGWIICSSLAKN